MLNLIPKDKIVGKHVYFNIIFTQNLKFSYADTSAASEDYFMSGCTWSVYDGMFVSRGLAVVITSQSEHGLCTGLSPFWLGGLCVPSMSTKCA